MLKWPGYCGSALESVYDYKYDYNKCDSGCYVGLTAVQYLNLSTTVDSCNTIEYAVVSSITAHLHTAVRGTQE
ncbi:uncharacterized protein YALI1_C29628g [Yarrowia lipolytica]|uniref:Uncharacterized protein n=1 Tax=Yarrowia lipolytica TaxID=4952 RepID=A0A1D8NC45_YARLL|nr:hypothetical protein YALI1_C29628g [Yarrowia lipolytica]